MGEGRQVSWGAARMRLERHQEYWDPSQSLYSVPSAVLSWGDQVAELVLAALWMDGPVCSCQRPGAAEAVQGQCAGGT